MKAFILDIIPKIEIFSRKIDDLAFLINQHWVSVSDIPNSKTVFIFRSNNQLLISENGVVEKASWEYVGNQSLLIEIKDKITLFKHAFIDENLFALKQDSSSEYVLFINETKYGVEINTIDDLNVFLELKYLKTSAHNQAIHQSHQKLISRLLPKPNFEMEQMLKGKDSLLIETTLNWKQFCNSHSEFYPLYTYQELQNRGTLISERLMKEFEKYAKDKEFRSFSEMKKEYFH